MTGTQTEVGGETVGSQPLELVHRYLEVLRGTNVEEYEAAKGMLDDVMRDNTPIHGSYENATYGAIRSLGSLSDNPQPDELALSDYSRRYAAIHVVRSMLQGEKLPVDGFGETIADVLHTLAVIDKSESGVPTSKHFRLVRREVKDVLGCERGIHGNSNIIRRATEAFKFVGRPKVYGRFMMLRTRLFSNTTT